MRAIPQTTLAGPATLAGVGVHSGASVRATLRAAPADAGVVFRVGGGDGGWDVIEASIAAIRDTRRCTTLANAAGASVATVEHLLAALTIASIDNLCVDLDAAELPILDGSAAPFVAAIKRAGVKHLAGARQAIRILAPIEVADGDRFLRAEPFDGRVVDIAVEFSDAVIGSQRLSLDLDDASTLDRLAQARTFCRMSDVAAMREAGLGRGGSLENAVVVDGGKVLNPAGLRDPEEFALHKALDLVGDLRLAGAHIVGRIVARRPGHDLNALFLRKLASAPAAFERIVAPARPPLAAFAERSREEGLSAAPAAV